METVPTVGMEVKLVKRGGLNMKCWDIGGQAHYRSQWGRYTRGCDVIIYVVDAHAVKKKKKLRHKSSHALHVYVYE
jgi:ADP-ribosylation factor-like protein 8